MKNSIFLITFAYFAIVTGAETTVPWSKVIVDEPLYGVIDDVLVLEDKNFLNGTRILGEPASLNEFTFQVGLKLALIPEVLSTWCGGVILSKNYILTAAHCLIGNKYELLSNGSIVRYNNEYQWAWYLDAYFGWNDLNQESKFQIKNVYSNPNFIIHHEYHPQELLLNDIALVHMPEPIVFGEFIEPASIGTYDLKALVGQTVLSSGWGLSNDYESDESSRLLRSVALKVISHEECKKFYKFIQKDKYLCLIHNNNDSKAATCQSDSGGPIVIEGDNGKNIVVGITSLGSGASCLDGAPLVVTPVNNYEKWIEENMKKKDEEVKKVENKNEEEKGVDKEEEKVVEKEEEKAVDKEEEKVVEKEEEKVVEKEEEKAVDEEEDKQANKKEENKDEEEESNENEEANVDKSEEEKTD